MDNNNIINNLIVVANDLENNKLYDEAKIVDKVIYKVAAKNKIDMDARVESRNELVTKQMIYSYEFDVNHVKSMMSDKENPANVQALKEIADRTEIALDKPDDYEGVLSLLESGLEKYRNHLSKLRAGSEESVEQSYSEGGSQSKEPKFSGNLEAIITLKAAQYGIPENLLKAMVNQESGGHQYAHSGKGASGIMQLMPGTARGLGVKDIYSVEENIDAGCRYLKQQYDKFGKWALALAAYNAGPAAVESYGNKIPPYKETQDYVRIIMGRAGMTA